MLSGKRNQPGIARMIDGFDGIDMCGEVGTVPTQVPFEFELGFPGPSNQRAARVIEGGDDANEEFCIDRLMHAPIQVALVMEPLDRGVGIDDELRLLGLVEAKDIGFAVINSKRWHNSGGS
jgi:hypothetical protein